MGSRREKKVSTLAEELHKPIRRKFKKRRVLVNGIDKIWAADLVDMQAFSKFNRGVKYLLAVIDVSSIYRYGVALFYPDCHAFFNSLAFFNVSEFFVLPRLL